MERNWYSSKIIMSVLGSLSARRAWIEMTLSVSQYTPFLVALRKESVDRNTDEGWPNFSEESLSARRAWIEISPISAPCEAPTSLSARRAWIEIWA